MTLTSIQCHRPVRNARREQSFSSGLPNSSGGTSFAALAGFRARAASRFAAPHSPQKIWTSRILLIPSVTCSPVVSLLAPALRIVRQSCLLFALRFRTFTLSTPFRPSFRLFSAHFPPEKARVCAFVRIRALIPEKNPAIFQIGTQLRGLFRPNIRVASC